MAQTFGTFKSIADRRDREAIEKTMAAAANSEAPLTAAAQLPSATHQERVNAQMFKAIEILGRKLDRVDDERSLLTRRLALIESAASVDEKTGKLYLPVVTRGGDAAMPVAAAPVPKWMLAVTLTSTAIAVAALALVVLRPVPPDLTPEQITILNALAETRMGALNAPLVDRTENWAPVNVTEDVAEPPSETLLTTPPPVVVDALDAMMSPAMITPVVDAPLAETPPVEDTVVTATPEIPPATVVTDDVTPAEEPVELAAITPAVPAKPAREAAPTPTTTDGPPPLVAGLDIGRDPALPAALTSVETRAMEGIPAAQHDLATIYAAGKQATQDYKRAAYWFAQAADGGIANAHYNLGVMFQQGLGVKKDTNKALGWYEKAAELGHPEAMYNLGIAYIEGVGTARNIDRGISFFEQAAATGVSQAAFNLGVLYESGFDGPIDLATAHRWYDSAAKAGHTEAAEALARLDSQLAQRPTLTVADLVEPGAASEETGQGDASPGDGVAYKNDLIGKVQAALIDRGFLPAPATGTLDARTEDAIRAWQRGQNLPVDGIPSLDLLGQITATPAKN